MKRIRIHHEGATMGPYGAEAGPWMANWRRAELEHARAVARGDGIASLMFEGLAVVALIRTLEGRRN